MCHTEHGIDDIIYFFFFNDTATTEIYTLSLHDALPISRLGLAGQEALHQLLVLHQPQLEERHHLQGGLRLAADGALHEDRSEEHTSELQSRQYLVCRLLLEKKKT